MAPSAIPQPASAANQRLTQGITPPAPAMPEKATIASNGSGCNQPTGNERSSSHQTSQLIKTGRIGNFCSTPDALRLGLHGCSQQTPRSLTFVCQSSVTVASARTEQKCPATIIRLPHHVLRHFMQHGSGQLRRGEPCYGLRSVRGVGIMQTDTAGSL